MAASFVLLYWQVIAKLVHDWGINDNYSHGYLIPPLAAYLAWERRHALASTPTSQAWSGLIVIAGSVCVLLVGLLGAELFLSRIAMLGTLVGGILFILGWRHLKMLAFPLGVLLLMIPIPAILFNQIVFPLQLVASQAGEMAVAAAGIPVLREGNVIFLANTTLEVAEACSGIRSLVSLLTLAIVFGYFTDPRPTVRIAIALMRGASRDRRQRAARRGDRYRGPLLRRGRRRRVLPLVLRLDCVHRRVRDAVRHHPGAAVADAGTD